MTSLVPLTNSIKRRRSRVSWMIECSPHITTSRGSSGSKVKARRSLGAPIKSDLDSLFDDIPVDGSPLPLKLIQDLNIASPGQAFYTPQAEIKTSTVGELQDDKICTNLMSLLAQETPEKEDSEVYHTPLPFEKFKLKKDVFYTPSGTPKITSPNNDISTTLKNLNLKKRRHTVMFANKLGDGSPIRITAPPNVRFSPLIELDDELQQPSKKRKVDTDSARKAQLPSQRRSFKRAQDPARRSRRLSQVVAMK